MKKRQCQDPGRFVWCKSKFGFRISIKVCRRCELYDECPEREQHEMAMMLFAEMTAGKAHRPEERREA